MFYHASSLAHMISMLRFFYGLKNIKKVKLMRISESKELAIHAFDFIGWTSYKEK